MTTRRLYLDEAVGESRGVVILDGRPERLIILRDDMPEETRLGAILAARVRKVEPAFASAFLDLGGGREALMSYRPDARPVQGAMLEVELRTEPRDGKLATVRVIGPAEGQPRLLAPAPTLGEQLQAFAKEGRIVEGREARDMADRAEAEALEIFHPLPGGGDIAIEQTRALVSVDVDLGERKGPDAKRLTRQANIVALQQAARILRLKGLGGIVIFDLVGRGHDSNALIIAARAAFSPDNPGVAVGAVSKFGTMELSIPRRGRSVAEILLDRDGRPTPATQALRLARAIESEGRTNPGARLTARCAPEVAEAFAGLAGRLAERIGGRFAVEADDAFARERIEVKTA